MAWNLFRVPAARLLRGGGEHADTPVEAGGPKGWPGFRTG
jgi:hypothetical protein